MQPRGHGVTAGQQPVKMIGDHFTQGNQIGAEHTERGAAVEIEHAVDLRGVCAVNVASRPVSSAATMPGTA